MDTREEIISVTAPVDELSQKAADLDISEDKEPASATSETRTNSLQVAAQEYPWMYMTSTLDACFKDTEATATKDVENKVQELEKDEWEISEDKTRYDAERLEFYDELASDQFPKDAPKLMQSFLSHGDACSRTESEALQIATKEFNLDLAMDTFDDILRRLEKLKSEAESLQASIANLMSQDPYASFEGSSESTVARATMTPLFGSCQPSLKARLDNISLAMQLVEGAKERFAIDRHLASLDADEDGEDEDDWLSDASGNSRRRG